MRLYCATSPSHLPIIKEGGHKNILLSYYYFKKDLDTLGLESKNLLIDSGAHTFFSERLMGKGVVPVKATKSKHTPEEYFEKYNQWSKDNRDKAEFFVELDIGEIVGQEQVNLWREEQYQSVGEKLVPVFHPEVMSHAEFYDIIKSKKYSMVASEGNNLGKINYGAINRAAYECGVRFHVFASTKGQFLTKYPIFSTDSTSWLVPIRFGLAYTLKKFTLSADKRKTLFMRAVGSEKRNLIMLLRKITEWEDLLTRLWEKRGIKWPR